MQEKKADENRKRAGTGFLNVLKSTIYAASGIQSKANRERDFEHGKPSTFIIAGIIFVALFILSIVGVVKLVLMFAVP
ncbi:hypothetical protein MNBD_GAMMA08-2881 [hydrothermal vent metagenome]|uniref:DUF2970 domain-containing protein n=1 Tax=hydrothermal vent metagenome TaxID=652676 RepID=A0A3B0XV65_9ZZZZ